MLRSFFEGAEDSYKPLATWVRSWKKQSYFGNTKEDITFYRFKYSPHAFIQIKDKVFITTDYRAYLFSEVCNMKSEPVKAVTSLFNYICDGDCHSPEVRQREWIRDILVPILSTIGAYKIAK